LAMDFNCSSSSLGSVIGIFGRPDLMGFPLSQRIAQDTTLHLFIQFIYETKH
jgi:hypothetical protein